MKQFLKQLMKQRGLGALKLDEMTIFNVVGKYGHYQVKVGPENKKNHTRPIEISGEIHHLFVAKDSITPLPTHEEINRNMQGTVIMKNIEVHLFDRSGKGNGVQIINSEVDGAHPHDQINLGGKTGLNLIHKYSESGKLANETYQIVQSDILSSAK